MKIAVKDLAWEYCGSGGVLVRHDGLTRAGSERLSAQVRAG